MQMLTNMLWGFWNGSVHKNAWVPDVMLKDQTMAIRQFGLAGRGGPSEEAREAELPQNCMQN